MRELTITEPRVKVLPLREEFIDQLIAIMNNEGWYYYDHHELMRYLNLNQDCFIISKDGRVIGNICTTNYDQQAWLGNIVIAQEGRGKGLAAKLIRAVIDHLRENTNVSTFRLGSVPLAIGLYKKVGFHAEAFTTAQEVALPIEAEFEEIDLGANIQVEKLAADDLKAVAELDEQYFKSNRQHFLRNIYHDSIKESCFCLKDQGRMVGFLMLRRRQTSKSEGGFAAGPDYAYRLGPSCILPEYGINGFKALFQKAIPAVNEEVRQLGGSARMYVVFPKSVDKEEIYADTRELAKAMGMAANINLERVFDEHDHIFGAAKSTKNEEQWNYMQSLGFHQEYFEQVMSYTPGEAVNTPPEQRKAKETKADSEGIFASATPGDKA